MEQAINAYRSITATPEFREIERLRSKARHDEAQALHQAWLEGKTAGAEQEREIWQDVIADKDSTIANKDAIIAELRAKLDENN